MAVDGKFALRDGHHSGVVDQQIEGLSGKVLCDKYREGANAGKRSEIEKSGNKFRVRHVAADAGDSVACLLQAAGRENNLRAVSGKFQGGFVTDPGVPTCNEDAAIVLGRNVAGGELLSRFRRHKCSILALVYFGNKVPFLRVLTER